MNPRRVMSVAVILIGTLTLISSPGCSNSLDTTDETTIGETKLAQTPSPGTGTDGKDNLFWTFWVKNGASGATMTFDGGRHYSIVWNGSPDMTAGKGWSAGTSNRVVNYAADFHAQSGGALGLYGWIKYPKKQADNTEGIEYYVVDQIADVEGPYNNNDGQYPEPKGTVESDGDIYDIYTHVRYDDNALGGGKTYFRQWLSIRRNKRTSGTITFQNHYNAWKKAGLIEGSWLYQIILVEGWPAAKGNNANNVGKADVVLAEYPGNKTLIDSFYNNLYMRLKEDDNTIKVDDADGNTVNSIWHVAELGNSEVALQSVRTGYYLTVDASGNVKATGTKVTDAEKFTVKNVYYYYGFLSKQNDKYLKYDGTATASDWDATSIWYNIDIY